MVSHKFAKLDCSEEYDSVGKDDLVSSLCKG
jgi:hypothetical protein